LIKSHRGYRFGGFRSVPFNKTIRNRADPKAFLFSLSRKMICTLKNENDLHAVYDDEKMNVFFG